MHVYVLNSYLLTYLLCIRVAAEQHGTRAINSDE